MTTTTPGFTADASLYNTSRHYWTSYRAPDPHRNTVGTIRPSEIDVPGEVIEIEDDAPWSPPSWGGHTDPGTTTGGEPGGGGGGGGGGTPSQKDPLDEPNPLLNNCSPHQVMSDAAGPCIDKLEYDLMHGVPNPHYMRCSGKSQGNVAHPIMECCRGRGRHAKCKRIHD